MIDAVNIALAALLAVAPVALERPELVSAPAPDFAAMQIQTYDPPKPAPAMALPDLRGKTVNLPNLKGKVVLVFFWATW